MSIKPHHAKTPHSAAPECVSPLLGEMGLTLHKLLPHNAHQQLTPILPLLAGTAGDGHDKARSHLALDWLVRTWLPTWLELSPHCRTDAATVRALAPIVNAATTHQAGPTVRAARDHADAAGDIAWATAGGDLAWAATRDTARDIARTVTRATAKAAMRAAAHAAAGNTTADAAWTAATDAATDAATAAAIDADTTITVTDAAAAALRPTVATLQFSVIELYRHMIEVGR